MQIYRKLSAVLLGCAIFLGALGAQAHPPPRI